MKEKEWKKVTEEELLNFLKAYPRELVHDFSWCGHSWNDFELGIWPDSMVARYDDDYGEVDCYICTNVEEILSQSIENEDNTTSTSDSKEINY